MILQLTWDFLPDTIWKYFSNYYMNHKLATDLCEVFSLTFKSNDIYQEKIILFSCKVCGWGNGNKGYICLEWIIFLLYSLFHTNCISSRHHTVGQQKDQIARNMREGIIFQSYVKFLSCFSESFIWFALVFHILEFHPLYLCI